MHWVPRHAHITAHTVLLFPEVLCAADPGEGHGATLPVHGQHMDVSEDKPDLELSGSQACKDGGMSVGCVLGGGPAVGTKGLAQAHGGSQPGSKMPCGMWKHGMQDE